MNCMHCSYMRHLANHHQICISLNDGNPCSSKLEALMQHVENIHFDVSDLRIIGLLQVGQYHYKLAVAPSQGSIGKLKFS